MSKDRTGEFRSTVLRLNIPEKLFNSEARSQEIQTRFYLIASQIGKDIQTTTKKLEKLAKLAQKRAIFNDSTAEIEELTYIIKQDITSLNQQIERLQGFSKGGGYDEANANEQTSQHTNGVVLSLKNSLGQASEKFKGVLETRSEAMKQQQQRRQEFTSGTTAVTSRLRHNKDSSSLFGSEGEDVLLAMPGASQQQQQQTQYLGARATAVESIQSTIVELGTIFQQLGNLVAEQDEYVQRIDRDVDDTLSNVERGQNELSKYLQSISGSRWLMIKFFSILVIFIIIFMAFA
eukprot:GCRY01003934.1.p1 GENE.GCRY01003934.1~~GCRY01003934.1.p1  ORF type:complete len:291 (+),score=51.37 GCRY01003934.1:207-1079(+)